MGAPAGIVGQRELIDAVACEREFEERPGEARAFLDEGEEAPRGDVEAAEGAAEVADRLADEPVVAVRLKRCVEGERGGWIALGLDQPEADLEFVGAHREDGVLEFARQRQRVPGRAGGLDSCDVLRKLAPTGP